MKKITYKEISSGKLSDTRQLAISECSEGGYTLGQKIFVDENGRKIEMFLKGAIHVQGLDELKDIRKAFDIAIEKIEGQEVL